MEQLQYDDPVKNAYTAFERDGYDYGSVISTAWFRGQFRLSEPKTIQESDESKMLYARYMHDLRSQLLINKKMALRSKSGVGQEVVNPADQTQWAMLEVKNSIAREIERARDRVENINLKKLTDSEQKDSRDALARLSFFNRKSLKRLAE